MKERPRFKRLISLMIVLALTASLCLVVNVTPVSAQTATFAPTSGSFCTTITVTGTGWAAGELINPVTVGGAAAAHTLSVAVGGILSGTITVPAGAPLGLGSITITGATSGLKTFANAFTVTPDVDPTTGSPGTPVSVAVNGTFGLFVCIALGDSAGGDINWEYLYTSSAAETTTCIKKTVYVPGALTDGAAMPQSRPAPTILRSVLLGLVLGHSSMPTMGRDRP